MSINELGRDYRTLKAPPDLLHNVKARLAEQDDARIWWPGFIGATATAVMVTIVFLLVSQQPDPIEVAENVPSFSTLSKIKLQKPESVSLSLANIKNVSIPPMPIRPKVIEIKPSKDDARINNTQEKDDDYV